MALPGGPLSAQDTSDEHLTFITLHSTCGAMPVGTSLRVALDRVLPPGTGLAGVALSSMAEALQLAVSSEVRSPTHRTAPHPALPVHTLKHSHQLTRLTLHHACLRASCVPRALQNPNTSACIGMYAAHTLLRGPCHAGTRWHMLAHAIPSPAGWGWHGTA